jgi:hypothetical protein
MELEVWAWIHLAYDRDQWRAYVNMVMYILVPKRQEISLLDEQLAASQE